MLRALLFASVGMSFAAHWVLADPSTEVSETQTQWPFVLLFSGSILALAVALPVLAGMVRRRSVVRVSLVPAAGATVSSLANVVEDGLQVGWAFFVFVAGSAILLAGLLGLTAAIGLAGAGGRRFLALVPAGTLAAVAMYVVAGGPIMLATWSAAATVAAVSGSRWVARGAVARREHPG